MSITSISEEKQLIHQGNFVKVDVSKKIYHLNEAENLYLKFHITNTSKNTIGIDLSNYWQVLYPNQWGIYKKPFRESIDEERNILKKIIDSVTLNNKFKADSLHKIKPNETLIYFIELLGNENKIDIVDKKNFLIISLDGQIQITNGKEVELISLTEITENKRDIVFSHPLNKELIPRNAFIIKIKN